MFSIRSLFIFLISYLIAIFNFNSPVFASTFPKNLAEYTPQIAFTFVNKQLKTILNLCLQDSMCNLSPEENFLIASIQSSQEKENKLNAELIRFDSSKNNPNLFFKDGNTRIAVTGDHVGDSIFINLDLAYQNDKYGSVHPLSLDQIIAVLIHELGHHQGIKNHSSLDQLGLKIGNYFLTKMQWTAINGPEGLNQDPDTRPLQIFLANINFPFTTATKIGLQNLIWIFDEYKITDISDEIGKLTQCENKTDNSSPQNIRLLNWEATSWRFGDSTNSLQCPSQTEKSKQYVGMDFYTLWANLQQFCQNNYKEFNVRMELGFHWNCSNQKLAGKKNNSLYFFERIQNFIWLP